MSIPSLSALPGAQPAETLDERVSMLFEELDLAIKWQRPSILLGIYRSEFVCARAQWMLEQRLTRLGQHIYHVTINLDEFDIPMFLSRYPEREKTVFFVSSLKLSGKRAGYHAYRALNMRRELLVDYHIRVVFWLTETEAADLPAHAPDFWVFRHRVIEFLDAPAGDDIAALAGPPVLASSLYQSPARTHEIIKAFQKAARVEPDNAVLWRSLGGIYRMLNRPGEALRAFRKAARLDPQDAGLWISLGDLYHGEKRTRDARKAYAAALALEPENERARAGLALCDRDAI